jgi:E3 ubiquitin-protein ligase DOA10
MGQTPEELYLQELKEAQPVRVINNSDPENNSSCRFCWSNETTQENPCIVACRCSGSVGFIHYLCLKAWLAQKM